MGFWGTFTEAARMLMASAHRLCPEIVGPVFFLFGGLGFAQGAEAETLSRLLALARSGEPVYQGAKANMRASEARSRQAFGALLPQVSASANSNYNSRDYITRNSVTPMATDLFNSHSGQLNITQPIWRQANFASLEQADAVVAQTQHQLTGTEQELSAKLVSAWLDVVAAGDNIAFTHRQMLVTRRQWEIARRGAQIGTWSAPQAEEALGRYEQAVADSALAKSDSDIKFALLEQIVGPINRFEPPQLRDDAVFVDLKTDRIERWLEVVETSNPALLAARGALDAAVFEVKKQQAGHQPTLDLVGSYSNNVQAVGGFPGQAGYDIRQRAVGLQLNIPLYSGGTQTAKVDEAIATREKARADVEAARRAAILAAKQGWAGWQGAEARNRAGLQAIAAARAALAAARSGVGQQLRTELDVLQAEQLFHAGLRDSRKGRYDQIASYVRLKVAAGVLTEVDVTSIDKAFDNFSYRTPEIGAPVQ
jgi:outer membrane protein